MDADIAGVVSQSCKAGKRRCDKRLPACSRCRQLNKFCEYPAAPPCEPATFPTHSIELAHRAPSACARCRANKRKCDRTVPSCSRCLGIRANCTYRATATTPRARSATRDVPLFSQDFASLTDVDVRMHSNPPIVYRSYMSRLLQFFLTSIALPSGILVTDSLASHLHSQWIQHAMSDACLFHATLFSASASIDMLRGQPNSTLTLYHQTWAIRLINERLTQPEPAMTYGVLGAVIPLLYYNMVGLDRDSAVTHQKGLGRMLLQTPKAFRADIGPLIAIVKLYDCLYSKFVRPKTLLRNIVSRASLETGSAFYQKETIEKLLDVYEVVSRLDHLLDSDNDMVAEVDRILSLATINDSALVFESDLHHNPVDRINACCQLSCEAFWKILRRRRRFEQMGINDGARSEATMILEHIQNIEPLYWIRNAPETFAWVVFTGAAACSTGKDRAAFVGHAGTILTAVDGESLTLTRQGWRYFQLLRKLAGHEITHSVLDN
ncbi:hypothetical protein BJY04DRAFT_210742 [Aspergillus karnatakaensis]|uniref:uncharacterized protein n=1 Tax=Aspergillus karnatakaensis TaxID=1810916 RepID=UPI003CCCD911